MAEVFEWKIGKVEVNPFYQLVGGDEEILPHGRLDDGCIVACGQKGRGAVGFDSPHEAGL